MQPGLILFCGTKRWPKRTPLPEWKIQAQHRDSYPRQRLGQPDQKRGVAIASSAVREYQTAARVFRAMEKATDTWVIGRLVLKWLRQGKINSADSSPSPFAFMATDQETFSY